MFALSGKNALVTGGSRGIGAAIVRQLAQAGAHVVFTFNQSQAAADRLADDIRRQSGATGGFATALKADSADADAIQRVVGQAAALPGGLDILVNNAGIIEARPIEEFTLQDYERQMSVNARAVFAAIQRASQLMNPHGRIVNIGSNLAQRVPRAGLSLYAMSKAAVWGLTKGAARDLGPRGITVNIIQPGSTDTDMNPADGPRAQAQQSLRAIPAYNSPDEIAQMVLYLCSDAARSVTGASFLIDGGANI